MFAAPIVAVLSSVILDHDTNFLLQKAAVDVQWFIRSADFKGDDALERIVSITDQGDRLFPYYESILKTPGVTHAEINRVFTLICASRTDADRSRFHEFAVNSLTHEKRGVRRSAIALLAKIGRSEDAPLLTPFLADDYASLIVDTARALAAIGGPNELAALEAWLKNGRFREVPSVRDRVTEQRDRLKARLDQAAPPKK
jgi:hypothetical protein